ncbi:MAG TPA: patatin-like phospholipase family protein [Myxococcota bacterium]|nr:patatin-like phospholipase family protein [Myxococcota bacterium]
MQGLVLTAGGARGAYQAGVLKRLGEIRALRDRPSPFAIVAGASAGAINGAVLAGRGRRFGEATRELARVWSQLAVEQVIRTDLLSLARGAGVLARDFVLGGLGGATASRSLFDASPLHALLRDVFPRRGIAEAIRRGEVYAVAITATSYHSGRSFTFVQGRPGHPIWIKSRRVVLPVTLTAEHVAASSAIPIVFPPVRVRTGARAGEGGDLWFGDGGLRLVNPFSPAIRLGASRIFAVGIRSSHAAEALSRAELGAAEEAGVPEEPGDAIPCPPLAQICGVFMNAIFLDHLDADLDHLRRMNELIRAYGAHEERARRTDGVAPSEPMRRVEPLVVSPSEDLALVAERFAHRMPRLVRFLLDGLGTPDAQSADLMSYLLFDAHYTRTLVEIGYRDAAARVDEIEAFLRGAPAEAPAPRVRRPLHAPLAPSSPSIGLSAGTA